MQLSGKGTVQNHFITMVRRPWMGFYFGQWTDLKDLVTTVRWTVAATSANTGGYINFKPRIPAGLKMQTNLASSFLYSKGLYGAPQQGSEATAACGGVKGAERVAAVDS